MDLITKATINIREGVIDLEGSEDFVKKYLDEFKEIILNSNFKKEIENNFNKKSSLDQGQDHQKKDVSSAKASGKLKTKAKDVKPEEFDIYPKDKISLEDFINEKKPGSPAKEKIIVIAYFIKNTLSLESFSEGNIEYVYRTLKFTGKPIHLRQMLTDMKNKDMWLDNNDSGGWTINRVAEKFVDEKMPQPEKTAK